MFPRMIGTEWETCMLALDEDGNLDAPFLHRPENQNLLFKNLPSPPVLHHLDLGVPPKRVLSNGGMIYVDSGHHIEYASPEGLEAREALLHYKVGELILWTAKERTNRILSEMGVGRKIRLFRGNLAAHESYGFHENYLIKRSENTFLADSPANVRTDFVLAFLPFLMSRPLHGGIGWIEQGRGNKLRYLLSQRTTRMVGLTGSATTTSRAIINTRDEPHASQEHWRRLHLICGDTIGMEPALFLTLFATSAVLDMLEEGFHKTTDLKLPDISRMSDSDIVNTWQELNNDPALKASHRIGDKTYTIVDISEVYRDAVRKYYEARAPLLEEEYQEDLRLGLNLWDWVIEKARGSRPHEALRKRVEWAAKLCLAEKYGSKYGFDLSTPHTTKVNRKRNDGAKLKKTSVLSILKDLDYEFHESGPESILADLARRNGVDRIVTDEEIQSFISPPPTCRSFFRGRILKALNELSQEKGPPPIKIGGPFWSDILVEMDMTFRLGTSVPVKFTFNI